ncbi:MarR family winged helix-turn-helix transcriptional regulator [Oceanithermus sp.]
MVDAGYDENSQACRFVRLMNRLRRWRAASSLPPGVKISPALMPLVDYLAEHPGSSVGEVAAAMGLSAPTVSVSLRRLERMGLIERRPHPKDHRAVQLYLSRSGLELQRQVRRFRQRLAEAILEGLEPGERDQLLRLLAKAMEAADEGGLGDLADLEPPSPRRNV